MTHRNSVRLLAATLALLFAPAGAAWAQEAGRHVVEPRSVDDLKAVFATVASVDQTAARARIGGTIERLAVDEGATVERGQVIAVVGDTKLQLQLTALDARIQSLAAQRRQAETDLDRARQLRSSGTIAQARYDDAQTALDVIDAQIAAMRAERAVVAELQKEGAVMAPAAGRVLQVKVVEGTVVMPGEPVATIATRNFVLRLHLPERHARSLRVGDPVLVGRRGLGGSLTGAPEELREGFIRQVYPELENGQVVADVQASGLGDFFVGERVRVMVATGTREAVVIPIDYVFRRYGLSYVRLAEAGDTVVQTGRSVPAAGGTGIEILSGVRAGDVLVKP